MEKYYSLRIPEPCHEDWSLMTPSDKGRFCSSCDKTVIDFTVMSDYQIKDFLLMSQGKKLCGHVKISQLDLIHIKIPIQVLSRYHLGHRSFLLALLIVMGTTLMSCKDDHGNKQKINQVEVVDSLNTNNEVTFITGGFGSPLTDPNDLVNCSSATQKDKQEQEDVVIAVMGNLPIPPPPVIGKIVTIEGDLVWDEYYKVPYSIVQNPPKFINTPHDLEKKEEKDYFNTQMRKYVTDNFDKKVIDTTILGRQKAIAQFEIDTTGYVIDVKVKAPYAAFENEALRVIKSLPQFSPASNQLNNAVSVIYSLPIIF